MGFWLLKHSLLTTRNNPVGHMMSFVGQSVWFRHKKKGHLVVILACMFSLPPTGNVYSTLLKQYLTKMSQLIQFKNDEVILSDEEAFDVFVFFFGRIDISKNDLSSDDKAFAQALLVEAINASNKMGVLHAIAESFLYRVPTNFRSIGKMLVKFMVKAPATWWNNKELYKMTEAKIYDNVRTSLARNFKSEWAIRESTGDLVAY